MEWEVHTERPLVRVAAPMEAEEGAVVGSVEAHMVVGEMEEVAEAAAAMEAGWQVVEGPVVSVGSGVERVEPGLVLEVAQLAVVVLGVAMLVRGCEEVGARAVAVGEVVVMVEEAVGMAIVEGVQLVGEESPEHQQVHAVGAWEGVAAVMEMVALVEEVGAWVGAVVVGMEVVGQVEAAVVVVLEAAVVQPE